MKTEAQRIAQDIAPDADSDDTSRSVGEVAREIVEYWADDFRISEDMRPLVCAEVTARLQAFRAREGAS